MSIAVISCKIKPQFVSRLHRCCFDGTPINYERFGYEVFSVIECLDYFKVE